MKKTYVLLVILCFSCDNNQDSFSHQLRFESNSIYNSIMKDNFYPQQQEIKLPETRNELCQNIKELDFYKKNGKVIEIDENSVVGEFKSDSMYSKILLENCIIKYRAIESRLNCSKSFAKYNNGKLVFYDSTDWDCNIIIHFVLGIENYSNAKMLPKYLQ
jgi:hypothetical protein